MHCEYCTQIGEYIRRKHSVLRQPFCTQVGRFSVKPYRTYRRITGFITLTDECGYHAGKCIAASSACKSGIACGVDENSAVRKRDVGNMILEYDNCVP